MDGILIGAITVAVVIAICAGAYVFRHGADDTDDCMAEREPFGKRKISDMTVGELIGTIIIVIVMCAWCFVWPV